MRWWVVGAGGMLGRDLVDVLRSVGEDVVAADRGVVDVTDPSSVDTALAAVGDLQVVVNCAAWTAVDDAEAQESSAFAVNAVGPQVLARAAAARGARMVQVSTDYVFDGAATKPYAADGVLAPRSAYGRTKAAGEWAVRAATPDHLVVRTAWLYGEHGPSFPRTIARLLRERGGVDVVADQVGQPTWTRDLAELVHRLVVADAPSGTYHGTSSGRASWFELAQEVARVVDVPVDAVRPTTSEAFVRPAPRPAWSVLSHDTLRSVGVDPIGDWRQRWRLAAPDIVG
ncbi:dTDP-4-dehydrorhamnose reductase [Cellulomonas sp. NPDC057328]|uniref:dTDP-4-dehydrorhamnose reductase n=1 Tax=Cellulomonas sp. NPDC057328 TaxID=3346101 RepID=UPI003631F5BA